MVICVGNSSSTEYHGLGGNDGIYLGPGCTIPPYTFWFEVHMIPLAIQLAKGNIALDWKIFELFQDHLCNVSIHSKLERSCETCRQLFKTEIISDNISRKVEHCQWIYMAVRAYFPTNCCSGQCLMKIHDFIKNNSTNDTANQWQNKVTELTRISSRAMYSTEQWVSAM